MPGPYSRLSQRIKDDNVRKELERRSKSSLASSIASPQKPAESSKPELTTVTSNDNSIRVIKNKNNYDLSIHRYIGGYETYFLTQKTPDQPEVNGEEQLPINYAIDDGWVPFVGEIEIINDKIGAFKHTANKYYTDDLEFRREMIYFEAPENGVYRFEVALFLTIGPRSEEEETYCWPENYKGVTGNSRVNLDVVHLILVRVQESDLDPSLPIRPLEKVVSLVDRFYNKKIYGSEEEGWNKSMRYCSLHRTVSLKLYAGDIIIPMYHVEATQYRSSGGTEYVNPFPDNRTYFCQQLECFYAQYCNDNEAEYDNIANEDLVNIISYYD